MPTVETIEQSLFAWAPRTLAMDWDNVGLLIGDPKANVSRVLVALDITEAVADEAIAMGAQLIVAHHPVMNCTWFPVQSVREDRPQGHLLMKLLRAGISAICMHTNLDCAKGGVNDALAEVLKLIDPGPLAEGNPFCRVGRLQKPMPLAAFSRQVCQQLRCNGVRYVDAGRPVERVAVGGGACADFIGEVLAAGCDTFVTSDVTYHQFLDAIPQGINLIDAGHFPTEDVVCPVVISHLRERFPALQIEKSASHREVIQYDVKGE